MAPVNRKATELLWAEHYENSFPQFSPSFWGNFTVCSGLNTGERGVV